MDEDGPNAEDVLDSAADEVFESPRPGRLPLQLPKSREHRPLALEMPQSQKLPLQLPKSRLPQSVEQSTTKRRGLAIQIAGAA